VSCNTRREKDSITNGIYGVDLKNDSVFVFKRINEPPGFIFHPHGISLVMIDSIPRLFVISHDDKNHIQSVIKYKVEESDLIFEAATHNPHFISPNDLFALKNGHFFLTNDAGKRHSFMEQLFSLKRSTVVYFQNNFKSNYILKNLSFANGIFYKKPFLYVSTTRQNRIFKYRFENGQIIDKKVLTNLVGGDNIMPDGDNLLIAAHLNSIAFLRHARNSKNISPSVIYQVNPENGEKKVLFSNDGHLISAASTAIHYGNYLYVSQVFDNFILKVKIDSINKSQN
jgi:arylesterase/paraoxonase